MSDTKFKAIILSAAAIILLSAIVPLLVIFGGGGVYATAPQLASENGEVTASAITGVNDEVRGLWIATVSNINFPSKQGETAKELASELDGIVAFAVENGFNTIVFQVRPASDALYNSELFPPSKFVSGTAGKAADKDFDCLKYLLAEAHKRGISVTAWVNPLRVTTGSVTYPQTDLSALPETSPAAENPDWVEAYADGKLYFNAGIPAVRQYVADGVREICENYDVDGIIFDDYFYPYPVSGAEFDDAAEFALYGASFSDIGDFRRDSVNRLVELCYDTVKSVNPEISFGVSPFGIWQNNDGENSGSATRGLEAYDSIYCDALAWVNGGYVDFLAPQLYWAASNESAPFETLADWWGRALDGSNVDLYICHGAYRYSDGSMQSGEMKNQTEYSRGLYSYKGSLYYGYAAMKNNDGQIMSELHALFSSAIAYCDYVNDGTLLTVDGYSDGDTVTSAAITLTGRSDLSSTISVNGITPYRRKDGTYRIELMLADGDNLITVQNGAQKCEFILEKSNKSAPTD